MDIAVWAENTRNAGKLCSDENKIEHKSDEIVIYSGTENELREIAECYLQQPYSAKTAHNHKVGKTILENL